MLKTLWKKIQKKLVKEKNIKIPKDAYLVENDIRLMLKTAEGIKEMEGDEIGIIPIKEVILQKRYQENFELERFYCDGKSWRAVLKEKKERIPNELKNKNVVSNGYLKKIEIMDFPLKGAPVIFEFHRRRWKEKGSKNAKKSYHNTYILHPKGIKCTQEFAS